MKVACIDKSAADRLKLQSHLEYAFEQSRSSIGHLSAFCSYPASFDETLVNQPPDVFAIGSGFEVEEAYLKCRKLRLTHPDVSIILFLNSSFYNLRTLRRFQKVTEEIFTIEEHHTRLVFFLSSLEKQKRSLKQGKLIVLNGVKGGVGTTSIATGLAHAAEAVGRTAVLLDLSVSGVLTHYMATQRWQSPDYAAFLLDKIAPDMSMSERCLTVAPNGINLLLPPAGGNEIRELWLRDKSTFEITLTLIEILREKFDYIIVDTAATEGVLNFALNSQAHVRLLITSNEPASVHLLNLRLSELINIPGDSATQILINQLSERGLTKNDICDFLQMNGDFNNHMAIIQPLPFDTSGKHWMGTGNSFYTESSREVQDQLENCISIFSLSTEEIEAKKSITNGFFEGLKRLTKRSSKSKKIFAIRALPAPFREDSSIPKSTTSDPLKPILANHASAHTNVQTEMDQGSHPFSLNNNKSLSRNFYEPPELVGTSNGSFKIETELG